MLESIDTNDSSFEWVIWWVYLMIIHFWKYDNSLMIMIIDGWSLIQLRPPAHPPGTVYSSTVIIAMQVLRKLLNSPSGLAKFRESAINSGWIVGSGTDNKMENALGLYMVLMHLLSCLFMQLIYVNKMESFHATLLCE